MTQPEPEPPAGQFHRDRREHGGSPERVDDDQLARLTEEERVEAGVDAFDPDEVPAATDAPQNFDVSESGEFQDARAEIRHEYDKDELLVEGEREQFPPTRYDRQ